MRNTEASMPSDRDHTPRRIEDGPGYDAFDVCREACPGLDGGHE